MRRQEKEITDKSEIENIIRRAQVCRLALSCDNRPYIVPMCFGYAGSTLYMHSAREGTKLDMLRRNPLVCFEMDIDLELILGTRGFDCSMRYRSVIGFGQATLVDSIDAKRQACEFIMRQYSADTASFPNEALEKIVVIKVAIESMTGKRSG